MAEGIQETKQAIVGLMALAQILGKELKDGFQVDDLTKIVGAVLADPVKKEKLAVAVENIQKAPAEIADLQLGEALELAIVVVQELPALLEALKK